jgi:ABC-type nickel/cobalt efflux system permease component RcnA
MELLIAAGLLIIALMIFLGAVTPQGAAAVEGRLQLASAMLICLVGAHLLIRSVVSAFRKNKNPETPSEAPGNRGLFALALSVGVIPCPGVTLVMLFALNLGMIPAGIIAVLAMAIGMLVTTTLIGALFLAAGKSALKDGRLLGQRRRFIANGLSIGGALLIIGFGFLLLAGY